jgi:hypothetical protein
MLLKTKITIEEFNALPEGDKAHYSKSGDGKGGEVYHLQTEENTALKRSLNTERTEKERAVKLLKLVVPEMTDENRDEWEDLATVAAEHAKDVREAGFDLDEWKALKEGKEGDKGKGGKGKAEELAEQLLEAQKQVRELQREKQTLERDKAKDAAKSLKLAAENDRLVRDTAVSKALDAAKIIDPTDREVVTALLEKKGIVLREVGSGEEARRDAFIKIDGVEVPLDEHAKDFATTDLGKRFVKAPDNSGISDGPNPQPRPTAEQFAKLDPHQQLAAALDNNAAAAASAARR